MTLSATLSGDCNLQAYRSLAPFYDSIHAGRDYDRLATDVLKHFGGHPGRISQNTRIVDWGCGTGEYTRRFAAAGWKAAGFDISPAMVELARGKGVAAHVGNICGHWGQTECWPAIGQTCLFSTFSIACRTDRQIQRALENVKRWAAVGGIFVFDVVNYACAVDGLYPEVERLIHDGENGLGWQQKRRFNLATSELTIDCAVIKHPPLAGETPVASETILMRAFTPNEIRAHLHAAGMRDIEMLDPERPEREIGVDSYYFMVVAKVIA